MRDLADEDGYFSQFSFDKSVVILQRNMIFPLIWFFSIEWLYSISCANCRKCCNTKPESRSSDDTTTFFALLNEISRTSILDFFQKYEFSGRTVLSDTRRSTLIPMCTSEMCNISALYLSSENNTMWLKCDLLKGKIFQIRRQSRINSLRYTCPFWYPSQTSYARSTTM